MVSLIDLYEMLLITAQYLTICVQFQPTHATEHMEYLVSFVQKAGVQSIDILLIFNVLALDWNPF